MKNYTSLCMCMKALCIHMPCEGQVKIRGQLRRVDSRPPWELTPVPAGHGEALSWGLGPDSPAYTWNKCCMTTRMVVFSGLRTCNQCGVRAWSHELQLCGYKAAVSPGRSHCSQLSSQNFILVWCSLRSSHRWLQREMISLRNGSYTLSRF